MVGQFVVDDDVLEQVGAASTSGSAASPAHPAPIFRFFLREHQSCVVCLYGPRYLGGGSCDSAADCLLHGNLQWTRLFSRLGELVSFAGPFRGQLLDRDLLRTLLSQISPLICYRWYITTVLRWARECAS